VTLVGHLQLDLFNQNKCIPPLIDLNLKLYHSSNAFRLMSNETNAAHRLIVHSCKLIIRTKEVAPSLMLAHEQMLQRQNFRIPVKRVHAKHFALAQGEGVRTMDNILTGELPELVILGFVASTAMAGSYKENPFYFQHMDVQEIFLEANGERFPRLNWAPDFEQDYMLAYKGFLSALDQYDEEKYPAISYEEYSRGLTLFAFKLSATPLGPGILTGAPTVLHSPTRTGSVRLHVRFGTITPQHLNMIMLAQYKGLIEIDKFRNVVVTN
jgi:hypothetical protein